MATLGLCCYGSGLCNDITQAGLEDCATDPPVPARWTFMPSGVAPASSWAQCSRCAAFLTHKWHGLVARMFPKLPCAPDVLPCCLATLRHMSWVLPQGVADELKGKVSVVKIDTDRYPNIASRYGVKVRMQQKLLCLPPSHAACIQVAGSGTVLACSVPPDVCACRLCRPGACSMHLPCSTSSCLQWYQPAVSCCCAGAAHAAAVPGWQGSGQD